MVRALRCYQAIDQMAKNVLIGMKHEIRYKLSLFDEMAIDRIILILNVNLGCDPHETLDLLQYFSKGVMLHLTRFQECFNRRIGLDVLPFPRFGFLGFASSKP